MRLLSAAALVFLNAGAATLTPAWVELGPSFGRVLVRVIVDQPECPSITLGRDQFPMKLRTPVPEGFQPVCEARLPRGTRKASVDGQKLALPGPTNRVVAIGDTGCRIQGKRVQGCNDPDTWPFATVAKRAAEAKPDLVVHVGDYLYREEKCPDPKFCGGSPDGDNWLAWNADFFTPAAPLLAAAPWAFSRGNHESCARSWRGWFYYLDPGPWTGACVATSDPYIARTPGLSIAMLDSSAVNDAKADPEQVEQYAGALRAVSGHARWLADHHPFWAWRVRGTSSEAEAETGVLAKAWEQARPIGFTLVLSGHTHLFEYWGRALGHPAQLVAGDAGTSLASAPPGRPGGVVAREFGYTMITRLKEPKSPDRRQVASWGVQLVGVSGKVLADCGGGGCR